jgi:hypothetical protein
MILDIARDCGARVWCETNVIHGDLDYFFVMDLDDFDMTWSLEACD